VLAASRTARSTWCNSGVSAAGGNAPSSPGSYAWVENMVRFGGCEQGQWHEGPACRRRFFTCRIAHSVPLTAARRVGGALGEAWEHDRGGQQLMWIETNRIFVVSCANHIRLAEGVGRGLKPGHTREGSYAAYIVVRLSHSLLDALEGE
jgi:hypothetical protein